MTVRQGLWRRATAVSRGRSQVLIAARVVEQGCYGAATVLLARWLGVDDFAPIGALVVFNTFAVVASDFGVGTAIMGGGDRCVGWPKVHQVRVVNLMAVSGGAVGAIVLDGAWSTASLASGFVWAVSAEAFVRKSALLRLGRPHRVALVEVLGSLLFLVPVVAVAWRPERAMALTGAGIIFKHAFEAVGSTGWRLAIGTETKAEPGEVWWTQVLAHAISNVDFIIIGILVSPMAFAVYSLGFRTASLITSQLSYAIGRVVLVDLAASASPADRQRTYDRSVRHLFFGGAAAGGLMIITAPIMPLVLGHGWDDVRWVIVLLSVGTAWRMMLNIGGALMITGGRAAQLRNWEIGRLAITTAVLTLTASGGLWVVTAAVTALAILSSVGYNHMATTSAGVKKLRLPEYLALPALTIVVVCAGFLL